jgi:transposase InsO family protein
VQHEQAWQLLRQRCDGELVLALKFELGERFETRAEAKEKLFDYVEVFYNQQRRHSSLDYVSPAGYEKASRAPVATA